MSRNPRGMLSPRTPAKDEENDRLSIRMIEVETAIKEIKDTMLTEEKMKHMMSGLVTEAKYCASRANDTPFLAPRTAAERLSRARCRWRLRSGRRPRSRRASAAAGGGWTVDKKRVSQTS